MTARVLLAVAVMAFGASMTGPAGLAEGQTAASNTYLDGPEPYPGFSSPYIGHDGYRNIPFDISDIDTRVLDVEREVGLRWTFAAVDWVGLEPFGPTDSRTDPTGGWAKLDRWVRACHARGLNLLLQPVMSGGGVSPPAWAGYRVPLGFGQPQSWTDPSGNHHHAGASVKPGPPRAPLRMEAAAAFIGRLVARYKPGGALAREEGWTDGYGVRAWEIDNEPDAIGLWTGELDDYAEHVTRARAAIKREDPKAIVLGPAGAHAGIVGEQPPFMMILDRQVQRASLEYVLQGRTYALGPAVDVVSFHSYEDLDSVPTESTYAEYKAWWDLYATQAGFAYERNTPFWMTEGGRFTLDEDTAPRWFPQHLARGFAAGIDRMPLQDLSSGRLTRTRKSAATFIRLFPAPTGLTRLSAPTDPAQVYRDGTATWTYVAWATKGTTVASIPVRTAMALVVDIHGQERKVAAKNGAVEVRLRRADTYNEPVYVVEQ